MGFKARIVEVRGSMARLSRLGDVKISEQTLWIHQDRFDNSIRANVKIGSVVGVNTDRNGQFIVTHLLD